MLTNDTPPSHAPISHDILFGAEAIAEFLFGSRDHRRKIYHLAEHSRLPIFRLGGVLCARPSVLTTWISRQEARSAGMAGLTR